MKLWALQQHYAARRSNSLRGGGGGAAALPLDSTTDTSLLKTPATSLFWLALHCLCCVISLVLGFRFSRLAFFLLFFPASTNYYSSSNSPTPILHAAVTNPAIPTDTGVVDLPPPVKHTTSRVVVGRHGIRIRPWPHPDPTEVMTAHRIIERVQREQRAQYGVRSPRAVVAVTPTYVRTFQVLHLTGLMHSLMLVPYELTWIIVEAGGASNDTAAVVAKSKLNVVHIGVDEGMPLEWAERHRLEAQMRLQALRVVRDRRLDGIVVFTDDSNMHSMEFFDEIQKVNWFGALSVGILAHSGNSNPMPQDQESEAEKENLPVPVQGPACNSSGILVGWHTFNILPYAGNSATYVGDDATVLPTKLEWAGFALNSRLVWKDVEDKPEWVRDLDDVLGNEEGSGSPLALLKDASFVEPLGNCGKKVMLWWLRVEARSDSKFPPGWIIDPPLEIVVPAKRTPWPGVPPEIPSKTTTVFSDRADKHPNGRTRRSRHRKRKHGARAGTHTSGAPQRHAQEK